ncbi:hypothetical protein LTR53_018732, partial [Teratosphaeriaceae sp. CCFEE 6253]
MQPFEYTSHPSRVVFGSGSIAKLPAELTRLNKSKPLLISTPQQEDQVRAALEPLLRDAGLPPAGLFADATMHTPTHITDAALNHLRESGADCLVSFGGGSTIGL